MSRVFFFGSLVVLAPARYHPSMHDAVNSTAVGHIPHTLWILGSQKNLRYLRIPVYIEYDSTEKYETCDDPDHSQQLIMQPTPASFHNPPPILICELLVYHSLSRMHIAIGSHDDAQATGEYLLYLRFHVLWFVPQLDSRWQIHSILGFRRYLVYHWRMHEMCLSWRWL